ncbi:MAG TPA: ATP-binding protein [Jatrophihabitans sp.]|nr:ATP-binding protein [Jatrophihabitans sp.]
MTRTGDRPRTGERAPPAGGAAGLRRTVRRIVRLPQRWWTRQSLRARLTLLATALFSFAVITGAVLLLILQRYALTRVLDQSASKTARDIALQVRTGSIPPSVTPTTGGITAVQIVDERDNVLSASAGADKVIPLVPPEQLEQVRNGERIDVTSPTGLRLRVVGRNVGPDTVLVFTDLSRVDDSLRVLTEAALIGGPIAVLLMALASYAVVGLTLRPVAALRHGAADITAAGLARQRLPVPGSRDEIYRLAVTLNAMLDRIDTATSRQRTFVGDAAHELRSPIASLRVQLEVSQRLGLASDWPAVIDDILVDVDRLDRLVEDLLTLARLDESPTLRRREPVQLTPLLESLVAEYPDARVPVVLTGAPTGDLVVDGDPDALRRVAINLINNAVKYAASEVRVQVAADKRPGGTVAVVTVEDDGPGIPEVERARVFDRFYRVQESRSRESGGTGLGLSIVREIVTSHDGRVQLRDRADGRPGLRAVVLLPAR